jgi:Asp-tRNA(Asn)/Glu-tRNA(Gln) amidotransferase A subunit family amidase
MLFRPTTFHDRISAFKAGTDSPSAFLERCLAIISAREQAIGAFVVIDERAAREQAAQSTARWRSGKPLSRIDGMPVGIKDIIETSDMPTQMGSPHYDGWQSNRDAASVFALREAGAVVLGKTVTTEFAAPPPRGTRNPWDPERTPGGSSSGSAAAVAAGMIPAALGTQGIGSIIRPASYCGCIGFKPTIGAVNRGGSHDGISQSAHGVLAASLEDGWLTLREIVGRIGGDPGSPGLFGPPEAPEPAAPSKLVLLQTPGWPEAHPDAKAGLQRVAGRVRELGVTVLEATTDSRAALIERDLDGALPNSLRINTWEMRWPLNTYRRRDASKISDYLLDRLRDAERMTLDDYRALIVERDRVRTVWRDAAADVSAIITLSAGGPAPIGLASSGNPVFAVPSSYLGAPSVSLPLLTVEGLPVGLQLIGIQHRDADLIAVARWISNALSGTPDIREVH